MKIYLDFDSTLVDSLSAWLRWINKRADEFVFADEVDSFTYLEDRLGAWVLDFWSEKQNYTTEIFRPIEGSIKFVDNLIYNYGRENIFIATSTFHGVYEQKDKLICELFDFCDDKIYHTSKKWLLTKDGILVDDWIKNIVYHCCLSDNYGILFNPNNRYKYSEISENLANEISSNIIICQDYTSILNELEGIKWKKMK